MSFDVIFAYGLDRISDSEKAPSVWSAYVHKHRDIGGYDGGSEPGIIGGILHLNLNLYAGLLCMVNGFMAY